MKYLYFSVATLVTPTRLNITFIGTLLLFFRYDSYPSPADPKFVKLDKKYDICLLGLSFSLQKKGPQNTPPLPYLQSRKYFKNS
jgi:hypothetical protein